MSRTLRSMRAIAGVAFVVGICSQCAAQFSESLRFDVVQIARPAEALTYELRVASFIGPNEKLITPRGNLFPTLTGRFAVNSFSEFAQEFFGEWTIVERVGGPTSAESIHTFNFAPFTLDDVLSIPPTILQPLDDASVPPTFLLEWQFPSGTTTTSRAISFSPGNAAQTTFDPTGARRVRFDVDRSVLGSRRLTLFAGTAESLNGLLSPVTLRSGPAGTNYVVSQPSFWNFAAVSVNVIPEPSLPAMCFSGVLLLARRRRNSGR